MLEGGVAAGLDTEMTGLRPAPKHYAELLPRLCRNHQRVRSEGERPRPEQHDAVRGRCRHCIFLCVGLMPARWASPRERITRVAPVSIIIRRRTPLTVGST